MLIDITDTKHTGSRNEKTQLEIDLELRVMKVIFFCKGMLCNICYPL